MADTEFVTLGLAALSAVLGSAFNSAISSATVTSYVASVTASTGLAQTNTTGNVTVWASLTSTSASLGSDVNLTSTTTYFDGPSVAQGTTGTWFVCGTVTVTDTVAVNLAAKLWDGSTIIDSGSASVVGNGFVPISLSGSINSPAGNLRISVKDLGTVNGKIKFNSSGNSMDSTITAVRLA